MKIEEAKKEFIKFVKVKTTMEPAFVEPLLEAANKQIARPPLLSLSGHYFCPSCMKGTVIAVSGKCNNCFNCGQKILWEE